MVPPMPRGKVGDPKSLPDYGLFLEIKKHAEAEAAALAQNRCMFFASYPYLFFFISLKSGDDGRFGTIFQFFNHALELNFEHASSWT